MEELSPIDNPKYVKGSVPTFQFKIEAVSFNQQTNIFTNQQVLLITNKV